MESTLSAGGGSVEPFGITALSDFARPTKALADLRVQLRLCVFQCAERRRYHHAALWVVECEAARAVATGYE